MVERFDYLGSSILGRINVYSEIIMGALKLNYRSSACLGEHVNPSVQAVIKMHGSHYWEQKQIFYIVYLKFYKKITNNQ